MPVHRLTNVDFLTFLKLKLFIKRKYKKRSLHFEILNWTVTFLKLKTFILTQKNVKTSNTLRKTPSDLLTFLKLKTFISTKNVKTSNTLWKTHSDLLTFLQLSPLICSRQWRYTLGSAPSRGQLGGCMSDSAVFYCRRWLTLLFIIRGDAYIVDNSQPQRSKQPLADIDRHQRPHPRTNNGRFELI